MDSDELIGSPTASPTGSPTRSPTIIGITGRKFHGKDTLSDYLVQNHGYIKISFAQPIKEISKIMFGFNDEQLHGDLKETIDERWNITPRQCFQFIGSELFRDNIGKILPHIGKNIWAHCLVEKIKSILIVNPDAKFVISDLRFPNEIEALRSLEISSEISSKIIRIFREDVPLNDSCNHESEALIDKLTVDYEIFTYTQSKDILFNKFEELFKIISSN